MYRRGREFHTGRKRAHRHIQGAVEKWGPLGVMVAAMQGPFGIWGKCGATRIYQSVGYVACRTGRLGSQFANHTFCNSNRFGAHCAGWERVDLAFAVKEAWPFARFAIPCLESTRRVALVV